METTNTKNDFKFWIILLLTLSIVISTFLGAIFGFIGATFYQKTSLKISRQYPFIAWEQKISQPSAIKQRVVEEDSAVIAVVEKSTPAVVSVIVSKDIPKVQDFFSTPFGNLFPFFEENNPDLQENPQGKQKIGGGTGFLITKDGMIITNKHVVSDAGANYTVITNDNKEYPAKVLALDPNQDIAIIKIEPARNATPARNDVATSGEQGVAGGGQDFPILELGSSDSLKIGQTVIAIGNSLGEFSNTVSRGIISGLKRNITAADSNFGIPEKLNDIIQTDAAINPGNSGGPLLNISGEVIGVNVAIAQGAQNIGFAIPSNDIKKVVEQVKSVGRIITPYLGVRYLPLNETIQKNNSLPYAYGALVVRGEQVSDLAVVPGSPADLAGIVENDIILEINGVKIDDKNPLSILVAKYEVGEEINLKIWHKGSEKEIKLKLAEKK
jgi:serine protease Do